VSLFDGRRNHRIKSWPDSFAAAISGRKPFEVRRDDRSPPYDTGDLVTLQEWRPPSETEADPGYTGRSAAFLIGYVERGPHTPVGWCVFELIAPEVANRIGLAVLAGSTGEKQRGS
jgi:hypothetical protein